MHLAELLCLWREEIHFCQNFYNFTAAHCSGFSLLPERLHLKFSSSSRMARGLKGPRRTFVWVHWLPRSWMWCGMNQTGKSVMAASSDTTLDIKNSGKISFRKCFAEVWVLIWTFSLMNISFQPEDSIPFLWSGSFWLGQNKISFPPAETEQVQQVRGGGAGRQQPRRGSSLRHHGGPDQGIRWEEGGGSEMWTVNSAQLWSPQNFANQFSHRCWLSDQQFLQNYSKNFLPGPWRDYSSNFPSSKTRSAKSLLIDLCWWWCWWCEMLDINLL